MIPDISGFLDGLCAFFAEGTALGALVTFLIANLPTLAVTVSTVKRWLSGAKDSIAVVREDCSKLSAHYAEDIAALQAAVEAQKGTNSQVLAVLALAFGNSKLSPAVRAEIEKVVTGAVAVNEQSALTKVLSEAKQAENTEKAPRSEDLAVLAESAVLLQV